MTFVARTGGLLAALTFVPALHGGEAPNQTALREQFGTIVSIYGDLRRAGVYSHPAMPLPHGWTALSLTYEARPIAWAPGSPLHVTGDALDQPLPEDREELTLSWRQNYGTPWIGSETSISGSKDSRTGEEHWSDLSVDLVVPLWRARYQAVAIAVGSRTPFGDTDDWLMSGGDFAETSWPGSIELRGSFGLWLATLNARFGFEYLAKGLNTVEAPAGGDEIEVEHRRQIWDGAIGLGVRPLTWLRVGVELAFTRREWRARDDEARFDGMDQTDAPLVGTLELSSWGLSLTGWAGTQLGDRDRLDGSDRLVAGGAIAWVF
ncbi:MAG TPA: hypothetical protein VEL07_22345 [Planctomycetota bacterium]|nr:hypothetical protein [Planctomycetota bacterium]